MGDNNYPMPTRAAASGHAVFEIIKRLSAARGDITLVTLGPLTNIATALALEPNLTNWVRHCYVMGGAANIEGNVTPAAEYNIWCDPEAAKKVLNSGMPLTLLGWELSRGDATLNDEEMQQILALNTERARVAINCNRTALEAVRSIQGEAGLALADPVAMAVALDRNIGTQYAEHYVDIVCGNDITRGMTVVDRLHVTGKPTNAEVCFSIDTKLWKTLLQASLNID